MLTNNLAARFPNAKALKTEAGAQARVDKFYKGVANEQNLPPYVIVNTAKGFLAIVLVSDRNSWMMCRAIDCGCCVSTI